MSYTRDLSEWIRHKGQLDLAENYKEVKKANVKYLQEGVVNLTANHEKFDKFIDNEDRNLKSYRKEIIDKIDTMTEEQLSKYMKNLTLRFADSKVFFFFRKES